MTFKRAWVTAGGKGSRVTQGCWCSLSQAIRAAQKSARPIINTGAFRELAQGVALDFKGPGVSFTCEAVAMLQQVVEHRLIRLLEQANLCAIHADRVSVQPQDIDLVRRCWGMRA